MIDEETLRFFRENHHAVLATFRRDGSLQLSPVVEALGEDGRILISARAFTAKVHNILRDPRVCICGFTNKFFGHWSRVDGNASIVRMPEAMALLRFIYVQVAGQHPDWEEFERDMVAQGRIVIAIQPERSKPPALA